MPSAGYKSVDLPDPVIEAIDKARDSGKAQRADGRKPSRNGFVTDAVLDRLQELGVKVKADAS